MLALVTGGGGFLGRYVVEQLVARGDQVRLLARGAYPELEELGVASFRGSITDRERVTAACRGVDTVFHVASRVGIWGGRDAYYKTNVTGTEMLLQACRDLGVGRFVFTSSPSVTFGGEDQCGVDESVPYPQQWLAAYPETKALAEQRVLQANSESLRTCSLRPHLVWGPRDHHLTAKLVERARSGKLRRVGDGTNLVDTIYVENAAAAHLQAADALGGDSNVPGRAYFISQGEPVNCWQWIDEILALVAIGPVPGGMSGRSAERIGGVLERIYKLFGWESEPRMTRFLARQLATSHWFDISAARRDFGYEPVVSHEEGMRRLGAWLRDHEAGSK